MECLNFEHSPPIEWAPGCLMLYASMYLTLFNVQSYHSWHENRSQRVKSFYGLTAIP